MNQRKNRIQHLERRVFENPANRRQGALFYPGEMGCIVDVIEDADRELLKNPPMYDHAGGVDIFNAKVDAPTPVRVRFEDLSAEHVGGRFRIVEHRWSGSGLANEQHSGQAGVLSEWVSPWMGERRVADPTSRTGWRYFGPGTVLEWLDPPAPPAPKPIPRVGATVRLGRQFDGAGNEFTNRSGSIGVVVFSGVRDFDVRVGLEQWRVVPAYGDEWVEAPPLRLVGVDPGPSASEREARRHLDAVARALHPEWPEGSRSGYDPESLPGMIRVLESTRERLAVRVNELAAALERAEASRDAARDAASNANSNLRQAGRRIEALGNEVAMHRDATAAWQKRALEAERGVDEANARTSDQNYTLRDRDAWKKRALDAEAKLSVTEASLTERTKERDTAYAECRRLREAFERARPGFGF